jgi:hypothetical protein
MKRRFVLINSFPRMSANAEVELTKRFSIVCERSGFEFHSVRNSAEILELQCDFVVTMHEVSPKLTPANVLGLMWNPPSGIENIKSKVENVKSFDGYIPASEPIRLYLNGLNDQNVPRKQIADFEVYPSAPSDVASSSSFSSLMYLGVHWDGLRHRSLLENLAETGKVNLYGPPDKWETYGSSYKGMIPFDGLSVISTLAEHGIALCLHRDEHIQADVPSMRLFEAASAGCVIICDNLPFARRTFGDSVFIIPDGEGKADFVKEKLSFIRANPIKARQMAAHSKSIFNTSLSLDRLLPKIDAFGKCAIGLEAESKLISRARFLFRPQIDVICPVTSDGIGFALSALNAQSLQSLRLLIFHPSDVDVKKMRDQARRTGFSIVFIDIGDHSPIGCIERLNAILKSKFVTWLDPETEWSKDHLRSLFLALSSERHAGAVSSECVAVREDGGYIESPNYFGDLESEVLENRALIRFGSGHDQKWSHFTDRFGLLGVSNWLARREVLLDGIVSILENERASATNISEYIRANERTLRTGRVTAFIKKFPSAYLDEVRFW